MAAALGSFTPGALIIVRKASIRTARDSIRTALLNQPALHSDAVKQAGPAAHSPSTCSTAAGASQVMCNLSAGSDVQRISLIELDQNEPSSSTQCPLQAVGVSAGHRALAKRGRSIN